MMEDSPVEQTGADAPDPEVSPPVPAPVSQDQIDYLHNRINALETRLEVFRTEVRALFDALLNRAHGIRTWTHDEFLSLKKRLTNWFLDAGG
jgi:hypothetical protein